MGKKKTVYVIGCGVLGPEIRHVAKELSLHLRMNFLPGKLHNTPDILRSSLQTAIDEAAEDPLCQRIIIGYGLCGRGTVGIQSSGPPLVFPKIHDCIALFLGSDQAYKKQFSKFPGTYYITEGWLEEKHKKSASDKEKNIWIGDRSMGCAELSERFGEKNSRAITDFFSSWTSNYQRAAYIDTGVGVRKRSLETAKAMAAEHKWKFEKLPGNLSLIKKMLLADSSDRDILVVPPGHKTIYSATENTLASAPETGEKRGDGLSSRHLHFQGSPTGSETETKMRFGLGLDAGGTYTDCVIYDFATQRVIEKNKSLTTKWDFSLGISKCLAGLTPELLSKVELVSVSTTLATNAIVEGDGQKTGLLLMGGENMVSLDQIPHNPKYSIKGRLTITGREKKAVDLQEVRRIICKMRDDEQVTAFAVSGFGGSVNPIHELCVRDIIKEELGMTVCCGHELSNQLNLVTRAQTAVVNARIIPKVIRFFDDLAQVLTLYDISSPVLVVKGDGTLVSKKMAIEKPVETILSGPAASVAGARHITGLRDAMVVDVGGTTTDIGDIIDGEVTVCEKGAVVGGIKTHVRALRMKTVGLGGDSHICFRNGSFTLGPKRVAPLVWANEATEKGIGDALDAIVARPLHRQRQIILIAMEGDFVFKPTAEEERIYALLRQAPLTQEQLTTHLDLLSPSLLNLGSLEESGLVQRCGFTPTDLLHIAGEFRLWDSKPAFTMLEKLSASLHKPLKQITLELREMITTQLSGELIKSAIFPDFSDDELENSSVYKHIMQGLLYENGQRHAMKAAIRHPVIGIGAPAPYFLPKSCEVLGTDILIPDNADVANAIGAITSTIFLRSSLTIQPANDGRYRVIGVTGNPLFETLEDAEQWVLKYLQERLRKNAKKAGTFEEAVDVDIDDSLTTLSDGSTLFLERIITAYLKGTPDRVNSAT